MSTNDGTLDRALGGIMGLVLIVLPATTIAVFVNPVVYCGSLIIGAVLLITAVAGFCPAYRPLRLKACKDC